VAEQPGRVDLRVKYGNVLRSLGYKAEAEAQYRRALEIEPGEIEALINLAALAEARRERDTVYALMRQLIEHAPRSQHPQRQAFVKLAQNILDGKWQPNVLRLDAQTLWVTPPLSLKNAKRPAATTQPKKKRRR
jgi:tetratricopeptide (TPR) repeat protein